MAAAIDLVGVDVEFRRRGKGPFSALTELDLRAERGKVTCLLGPNGSGKTTLINVLTGLVSPTAGEVSVLGLDPRRNRAELLKRVAVVPQETALYPELTARENLAFHASYYGIARSEHNQRVTDALELVQLHQRAEDRTGTFSGGMQRRLALGKALMMAPDLLMLDEPTLGVDVQSREAIWTRIRQTAREDRVVLLTTNYMEEAQRLGDQIVIIDRGRNVTSGTLDELTSVVPEKVHVEPPRASLQDVFLHYTGRDLRD